MHPIDLHGDLPAPATAAPEVGNRPPEPGVAVAVPRSTRSGTPFHGWRIVVWCALTLGVTAPGQTAGVSVFIAPLALAAIAWLGWRGAWGLAAVVAAVVCVPIALWAMHDNPAAIGQHVDGVEPDGAAGEAAATGTTRSKAIRTPMFWAVAGAIIVLSVGRDLTGSYVPVVRMLLVLPIVVVVGLFADRVRRQPPTPRETAR